MIAQGIVDKLPKWAEPSEYPYIRVDVNGQVVLSKEDIDRIAEAVFERVKMLLAEEGK